MRKTSGILLRALRMNADRVYSRRRSQGERSVSGRNASSILVVEDNEDSAHSLKLLLEALGYETHVARDGEAAVTAAVALRPDVILMDIGLPAMNGYEAARRIRGLCADKPMVIVALTGWGQQADRLRSSEAGIDHHLVKPLDLAMLRRILEPRPAA